MTLSAYPNSFPKLTLDFVNSRKLDPRITFSRASAASPDSSAMVDGQLQLFRIDVPRLSDNGLLIEDSRTNLLLNSGTLATQNVTTTAAEHTISFYGTGSIALSGSATDTLAGTGIDDRVDLTFTPTAGTLTVTVTGTVTNAQLEEGGFPTSFIPTSTSVATRARDICGISGDDFSGFYNQTEGTVVLEGAFANPISTNEQALISIGGVSGNQRMDIRLEPTGEMKFECRTTSGGAQYAKTFSNSNKSCLAYKTNDYKSAYDGTLVQSGDGQINGNVPVVNQIYIGNRSNSKKPVQSSFYRKIAYYESRVPDLAVEVLTT